jgi:probable FeS assembly SUF system protein SufT
MTQAAREPIRLVRDCVATTVPAGDPTTLRAGEAVQIMQTLGGNITVRASTGALLRVASADADALGIDRPAPTAGQPDSGPFAMSQVVDVLQSVYDPEIPVNVVELGLIYRCEEQRLPDGGRLITIDMSMTAPGCGMGDILQIDAANAVRKVPGVDDVQVTLVWDPPWSINRMSEAARLQLGML